MFHWKKITALEKKDGQIIQIQPNEGKTADITVIIPDLKDLKLEVIRKDKQAPSFSSKTVNHRNIMILNILAPNLGTLIFI